MTEQFLNPKQAAELLNVSVSSIYNLITLGRIPAVKVGHNVRLIKSELIASLPKVREDGESVVRRKRRLRMAGRSAGGRP